MVINMEKGQFAFVNWNDLDERVTAWADAYYECSTNSFLERDGSEAYIVSTLKQDSFEKFSELFKRFDREKDETPEEWFWFSEASLNSTLPELITLRVLGEIFRDDFGFLPRAMIANEEGIFFSSEPISCFCSDEEPRNTKIRYFVRGERGQRTYQVAIVEGEFYQFQVSEIISATYGGVFFPDMVGFPGLPGEEYELFDGTENFSETAEAATVEMTVDELVEKFREKGKRRWEK